MSEEINGLTSQLHNPSTDQLHESLRLLVRKIRAQLEVLTKKNKLKEDENEMLKQQMLNLEAIIGTKSETENKLNEEIKEFETKMDAQRQRHSAIESQLLNELNAKRNENEQIVKEYELQMSQIQNAHNKILQELKEQIESMSNENNCIKTKIEQMNKENASLSTQLTKERDLCSLTTAKNNEHLALIQQLQNEQLQQTKAKKQQMTDFESEYKKLQSTMDAVIEASKEQNDSFWNEQEHEIETTAHPFFDNMNDHRRKLEIEMLPKRILSLQRELKCKTNEFEQEKNANIKLLQYWQNKTKQIETKNGNLCQRMENLERAMDGLSANNDRLMKENDALKAQIHNDKFATSAHSIFLQMKTKEERQKSVDLQQQIDILAKTLLEKDALINKFEENEQKHAQILIEEQKAHQSELAKFQKKLNLLQQLSQDEIEQTLDATINELQSILDGSVNVNVIQKKPIPHITDSDVGSNDDLDIIEAEHKLASYFERHKQRQIVINEVNEIEIVDDDDEDENECNDVPSPPLSTNDNVEAPYIVDADVNVSVSNVANSAKSNCSNSSEQSPDKENVSVGANVPMINERVQSAVLLGVVRNRSIISENDTLSVDQSVLAHDGSRDGSVVPEVDKELINEENDEIATNSNVFSVSVDENNSVDLIHSEAHQIIDELTEDLKELKDENVDLTKENKEMSALKPLIENEEKQKEIMKKAKNVWNEKMEQMIAETDEWFINEDGDIVLIYPQPENEENVQNEEEKKQNQDDDEVTVDEITPKIKKEQDDKELHNEQDVKEPLIEKNDQSNEMIEKDNVNNDANENEVPMAKTETFFNSFRIF